jgi:hypothetical protein
MVMGFLSLVMGPEITNKTNSNYQIYQYNWLEKKMFRPTHNSILLNIENNDPCVYPFHWSSKILTNLYVLQLMLKFSYWNIITIIY